MYSSAYSIPSQGIAPLTDKLFQYKKKLKALQCSVVHTWERAGLHGERAQNSESMRYSEEATHERR